MKSNILILAIFALFISCNSSDNTENQPRQISGIYPHLAFYNNEGECGTGAVVPWAGRLWVITYGPHFPLGKLPRNWNKLFAPKALAVHLPTG